ncbi:MAG: DUF167 family protein [Patescibacteria group bacterium]
MAEKIVKVKVNAGAKTEKLVEIEPDVFRIRVQEPPEKGRANNRVAELLAAHFKIPKSSVCLISGAVYREKIFSIDLMPG